MAAAVAPSPGNVTLHEIRQNQAALMSRINEAVYSSKEETIPLIDIGPSLNGDGAARRSVAAQIGKACREIGFFQITNHGVSLEAQNGVLEQAKRFFHQYPQAKKEDLHINNSALFRGWEPSDVSNVNPDDWNTMGKETKEAFNWGYEPKLDPTGGDGKYVELDLVSYPNGANVWPNEEDLPGFFESIRKYHGEVLTLARHLLRLFALAMELEESYFDGMTTHPGTIARLLYYPPQKPKSTPDSAKQEEEIGLGAHTDYECFTLLLSDANPGLEVLSPTLDPASGRPKWISAPAAPNSLTVNIADFFQRWTSGQFKSTVHRVVNRSPEKERYSVPFFFSVNYDQKVSTLPSPDSEGGTPEVDVIQAGPWVLERLRATLKQETK
ncbi:flavanone 3-hydroxylase [Diaporthe amygdali]|uniref:flavanone 3-hydroxylase n=1 Tax=Phomopsis amygdali TaxID=1214568 RepID=UPI0022FEBE1F|nr:flavanone 3-hydroxylase [Diaporthe amygdali]KAJ0122598.1 flavanone 3-hydroxylase [Diaporthe amygdali]